MVSKNPMHDEELIKDFWHHLESAIHEKIFSVLNDIDLFIAREYQNSVRAYEEIGQVCYRKI